MKLSLAGGVIAVLLLIAAIVGYTQVAVETKLLNVPQSDDIDLK